MFSKTNLFRAIVLSIGMLLISACGAPPKSKGSTVVFPTYSPNPAASIPPVSLVDGSGNNAPGGTTTQPPTSGAIVQPNPSLNNQTPWYYLNNNLSGNAGANDIRAMAYTGQVYRFGFALATDAIGQYLISLPAGAVLVNNQPGCSMGLSGQFAGGQAVSVCVMFNQPTQGQVQPIRIQVQGQSTTYGQFNLTQNIWIVVIPGQQDNYQFVVANGGVGTIPPVVNRLFVNQSFQNSGSTRETINSQFAVQLMKNNQVATIYNAQYSIEPANAGRIVQAFGGQIQLEMFVGGKATLVARGTDQYGQALTVRGDLSIPRQVSLKYTERSKTCVDSSDKAVLFCSNSSGNPYSLSVMGANGFGTPATIVPGSFQQQIVNLPAQKDSNNKWYANYTISVDGNQPNGAIVCEAVVLSSGGADQQRFIIPGL